MNAPSPRPSPPKAGEREYSCLTQGGASLALGYRVAALQAEIREHSNASFVGLLPGVRASIVALACASDSWRDGEDGLEARRTGAVRLRGASVLRDERGRALRMRSDVEVADFEGVLFDEVAAGFDVVAHQHSENLVGRGGVFHRHLQ